jgi:lysozyme
MITDVASLIKDHEGYRDQVYLDTLGYPTIGYGLLLDKDGGGYKSVEEWLEKKFQDHLQGALVAYDAFGFKLDEVRKAAVVDLIYNLGPSGFSNFKLFIRALRQGNWVEAESQLRRSLWFKQVGRRGPRICGLIRTGSWDAVNKI